MMGCLPEFERTLEELKEGLQISVGGLRKFVAIELYCTEPDPIKQQPLKDFLRGTLLEECVHFKRPDLQKAILQVMQTQLADGLNGGSTLYDGARSLVTFCGSPALSSLCKQQVDNANLMAESLAFYDHKLVFREEFY